MTKPRYTPDPAPEVLDPILRAHLERETNRISDLWPEDFEDRLAALELLFPYHPGTWPIIDFSTVKLTNVTAEIAEIPCSPETITQVDLYSYTTEQTSGFENITFGDAGSKLYVAAPANGGLGQGIAEYAMTTPYDLSTLSYTAFESHGGGYPFAAGFPRGMFMHPNGDSIFCLDLFPNGSGDTTPSALVEYGLASTWDITTMATSPMKTFYTTPNVGSPRGLTFSSDGLRFYTGDNTVDSRLVHQWDMTTAWDINTATYNQSKVLTDSPSINHLIAAVELDEPGLNLIVNSGGADGVYVFALSTPFDISTATYTRTLTCTGTSDVYGMFMRDDCSYLAVVSAASQNFGSYELG